MHLEPGHIVEHRQLETIHGEVVSLPDPDRVIHLQFRRFAGCPLCCVHLRDVARRYDEIRSAGIVELAVFHSEVDAMQVHQGDLPFAVVSDPARVLYDEFGLHTSARAVLDPRAWTGPLNPYAWQVGLRERAELNRLGRFGRGETWLMLPGDFLIAPDGRLLAAHYGVHANDHWSVDELLGIGVEVA
ncbi:peroxiredoxin-like family protein [Propionibacteriaceae bacterium Y2011]